MEPARRARPEGRQPPKSFTTGPMARSAVRIASASSRTSVRTAPCNRSSPTIGPLRACGSRTAAAGAL
eukprot:3038064-Pleurochrysis_carterae.AAC.1